MSMFSVTALDTLIDTTDKGSSSRSFTDEKGSSREKRPLYTYSPLAINSNRPRSPSPSSFSSSPFIVNFKGRRFLQRNLQTPSAVENHVQSHTARQDVLHDSIRRLPDIISPVETSLSQSGEEKFSRQVAEAGIDAIHTRPVPSQNFILRSVGNSSRDGRFMEKCQPSNYFLEAPKTVEGEHTSTLSEDEFFDAPESPASGSSVRAGSPFQPLSSLVLDHSKTCNWKMLDELEAEVDMFINSKKAFLSLKQQHEAVLGKLFFGSSLVQSHNQIVGESSLDLVDFSNELKQRIEVARLVASAVSRGAAKAEAEEKLEMVIDSKSREISRLRDKLHYYEILNHEMSQRNQESVESARRRRRERQRRLHLTLGCLAAAACLGVSATALYRYFPWKDSKAWRMSSYPIELGENEVADGGVQC